MKIIIDIPEDRYKDIQRIASVQLENYHFQTAEQIIANGVALPKGHGRLIDAKQFEIDNKEFWDCDFIHPKYEDTLGELIQDAPTIIVADEEESEDNT
jgi:hypothetical protein